MSTETKVEKPSVRSQWRRAARLVNTYYAVDNYLIEGKSLRVGFAIDGSKVSDKVFETAVLFENQSRGDKLYHLMVVDPEAEAKLNRTFRSQYLKEDCAVKAIKAQTECTYYERTKDLNKPVQRCLTELSEELNVDFLIIGSTGTRLDGQGADDQVGGVADSTLRSTTSSIVMIKPTSFPFEPDCTTYVLASDHSPACLAAFALLLRKVLRPGKDKLVVIYASQVVASTTVVKFYEEAFARKNLKNCSAMMIQVGPEGGVAETLCNAAKDEGADFLVLGVSGFTNTKLGSVSEKCAMISRTNIMIVKDPREVSESRKLQHKSTKHLT